MQTLDREAVVEIALSTGVKASARYHSITEKEVWACVEEFDNSMKLDYCVCKDYMEKTGGIMQCTFCTKGSNFVPHYRRK